MNDIKTPKMVDSTDPRDKKLPRTENSSYGDLLVATQEDAVFMQLLGGTSWDGVGFTWDQVKRAARAYGMDFKVDGEGLFEAGSRRDLYRLLRRDGLRVMAILCRFLERDEDPVQLVAHALVEAGYDAGSLLNEDDDE